MIDTIAACEQAQTQAQAHLAACEQIYAQALTSESQGLIEVCEQALTQAQATVANLHFHMRTLRELFAQAV